MYAYLPWTKTEYGFESPFDPEPVYCVGTLPVTASCGIIVPVPEFRTAPLPITIVPKSRSVASRG